MTSTARRDGPPKKLQSTDHDVWHTENPRMFNLVGTTSSPRIPLSLLMRRINPGTKLRPRCFALPLPVQAHQLHKTAAHGKVWDTPKELGNMQCPGVFGMHVCQGHKKALVSKNQKHRISRFEPRRPRRRHFSGPDGITSLVALMMGFLTKQCYRYLMVFVNQATRLGYIYLQKSATAEEMIWLNKPSNNSQRTAASCR